MYPPSRVSHETDSIGKPKIQSPYAQIHSSTVQADQFALQSYPRSPNVSSGQSQPYSDSASLDLGSRRSMPNPESALWQQLPPSLPYPAISNQFSHLGQPQMCQDSLEILDFRGIEGSVILNGYAGWPVVSSQTSQESFEKSGDFRRWGLQDDQEQSFNAKQVISYPNNYLACTGSWNGQDTSGVPQGVHRQVSRGAPALSVNNTHGIAGKTNHTGRYTMTGTDWADPGRQGRVSNNDEMVGEADVFGVSQAFMNESLLHQRSMLHADATRTVLTGNTAQHEPVSPSSSTDLPSASVSCRSLAENATSPSLSRPGEVRRNLPPGAPVDDPPNPSSISCSICDSDSDVECKPVFSGTMKSQKTSLRRHHREKHSDTVNDRYVCLLDNKNGSVCQHIEGRARNRRRHIERHHRMESEALPPTTKTRKQNPVAEAMLNEWFRKE